MAKKTFKNSVTSPADRFFNTGAAVDAKTAGKPAAAEHTHSTADTQHTQYTHKADSPGEQQRKSKRAQFLLYPDLLEDVKKIAHIQRKSVNGVINDLLEQYRQQNAADLEQYNAIYKGE